MNFLEQAQRSCQSITCQTARHILYEVAAESLRQIVKSRLRLPSDDTSDDDTGKGDCDGGAGSQKEVQIEITRNDIHDAYAVADRIGRRWAEKLQVEHEEYAAIVKLVLKNGRYLDMNLRDEVTKENLENAIGDEENNDNDTGNDNEEVNDENGFHGVDSTTNYERVDSVLIGNEQIGDKSNTDRNLQSDSDRDSSDNENDEHSNRLSPTDGGIMQGVGEEQSQDSEGETIKKPLPYMALFNLGQTDPCNLHTGSPVKGTASEWYPLPTLSKGPVHIPNASPMPMNKIKQPFQDQLYGLPAHELSRAASSNETTRTRETTALIDKMAYDGDTMWRGDWDIIQDVVEKNRKQRLQLAGKKRKARNGADMDGELIEIVPKSLINDNSGGGDEDSEEVVYIQNGDDENMRRITVNEKWSNVNQEMREENIRRKLGGRVNSAEVANADEQTENEGQIIENIPVGREPSALGHILWSSQDIQDSLGSTTLNVLDTTMLHTDELPSEKKCNVCHGALMNVGSVHLWEQIKAHKWKGPADEAPKQSDAGVVAAVGKVALQRRKAAHRLARRRRIFPNVELKNTPRDASKLSSKVLWTTKGENEGIENFEKQQSMELDIGECTLSIISSTSDGPSETGIGTSDDRNKKTTLAFRSLEISLAD